MSRQRKGLNVEGLAEASFTVEQLAGRNFYHFTDIQKDDKQPVAYEFDGLSVDVDDDAEPDDYEGEGDYCLANWLPDDCWVKRYVNDDDPHFCYLVYLVLDDIGGVITSGCIEEQSTPMCVGFIMFPGMENGLSKEYWETEFIPDKVFDDLRKLVAGKCMPLKFSFIGKKLPQVVIDGGGNGGSNTEYCFALQSAYRMAYMHMTVNTTAEGIIKDFNYSTYQSSGSEYGDMFSRPVSYYDRFDEVMDVMLYIYDLYSDEEVD